MQGKFILLIGPPGVGKRSLTEHIRIQFPEITFPVSCTTRSPRPGEAQGYAYYFVSKEEFERRIKNGEFLEWAAIDGGNLYGTLKSEILIPLNRGKMVFREVEVQGMQKIQKLIPRENLVIIFVDGGPWERLEKRILGRAPIHKDELEKRKERYEYEITFKNRADYIVNNPDGALDNARRSIEEIIRTIVSKQ